MKVPSTDQELVDHITSLIMDDQGLSQALDLYVRAVQGRSLDEDVSDSEEYWAHYTTRLMELVLRAATKWHFAPRQEEVVF